MRTLLIYASILPQGIKDDTGLDRMHGATIRYDQGMTQQYQNHTISSPGLHHYPPILPAQNFGLSAYPFFLNEETPPFNPQETWYTVTCEGKTITPTINAKIEKGFFYSGDQVWTCYRRNYFSVHVSFTLDPWISHGRLCLDQNGTGGPEDVHSMAVSLSAAIDNASGKRIELVQLTPKHDKGPQHEVMKKDLKPTLPRKSYRNGSYDTNKFYQSTTIMGPQVPLKRESNPSCQEYSPTSHTNNNYQHTFEKMQFKSATAKNGKRKAQQQYFCLIVELWVSIQNSQDTSPVWVKIGSRCSHPVVVRGRSPSRYSVSQ
jgi:meiosis-specific transcription factor NDT80